MKSLRFALAVLFTLSLPFSAVPSSAQSSSTTAHCPVNAKGVLEQVKAAQATTDQKDDASAMVCMAAIIVDLDVQIAVLRQGKTGALIVPPAAEEMHQ